MNTNIILPKGMQVHRREIVTISLTQPAEHKKNEEVNLLDCNNRVIGIGQVLESKTGIQHRVLVVA